MLARTLSSLMFADVRHRASPVRHHPGVAADAGRLHLPDNAADAERDRSRDAKLSEGVAISVSSRSCHLGA